MNHTSNNPIPVTIITGFLGSGKTTLLNHILSNQKGLKTAVLVNEFGKIGIDNDLIISTSENIIELSNGCICCSINGELLDEVKKILAKKESIEYLIIETTGLADPLPVAMTFLTSELRDLTRLDSIVTLVDADNFNKESIQSNIFHSQILYGDILILNKCDLVNKLKIREIESKINDIKPGARILRSNLAQVELALILSIGLFESDKIANKDKESIDHSHCDHDHGICENDHKNHIEIEGFTSLSYESNNPFSLRKFQYFLDNQLPYEIFRAKGILWFKESERRHIFHLAGKRFSIEDTDWKGSRKNQIVFIGKAMNHKEIEAQLDFCIDKEEAISI